MAPAYIRFDRAAKEARNATNVEFFQANAEDLFFIESNSIDFINFGRHFYFFSNFFSLRITISIIWFWTAYVLHEMPANNSKRIVNEMYRVLKPGGVLNGFESPFKRNSYVRDYFVSTNTWDEDWHVQVFFLMACNSNSSVEFSYFFCHSYFSWNQLQQVLGKYFILPHFSKWSLVTVWYSTKFTL